MSNGIQSSANSAAGWNWDRNSVQGQGSISAEAGGSVTLPRGVSVGFKLEGEAKVSAEVTSENGTTTFEASARVSTSASLSVSAGQAGINGEASQGFDVTFKVSMPNEAFDLETARQLNPLDAATWPVGTTVRLDQNQQQGRSLELTFRGISVGNNVSETEGSSMMVERTSESVVTVTSGKTQSIDAMNSGGISIGPAGATISNDTTLGGSSVTQIQFDISTPEGQAQYDYYMAHGELPPPGDPNAPGIVSMTKTETVDYQSDARLSVTVGPFAKDFNGASASNTCVTTTNLQTGEMTATATIQRNDAPPLRISMTFDKAGEEILEQRTYTITVVADETSAPKLNLMASGGVTEYEPVHPGDTVEISMTQQQVETLIDNDYAQYKDTHTESDGNTSNPLIQDYSPFVEGEGYGLPGAYEFMQRLTQSSTQTTYGTVDDLYTISANQDTSVPDSVFPGTIKVVEP